MKKKKTDKSQNSTHKRQVTQTALIKAIKGSFGVISTIARKLRCDRKTVYNRLDEWPELKELIAEEREEIIDLAENKLVAKIRAGEKTSIHYVLDTLGKSRGYVKKTQTENTNFEIDLSELTDFGLERIKRGDDPREVILDPKSRKLNDDRIPNKS